MKKVIKFFILVVALFITFNSAVFAQNKVQLIYVHGTNDNSEEKKIEFTEDVNRLHKELIKAFEQNETAKKYLLENGQYTIAEEPVVFYWGAESKEDLDLLSDWLDVSKIFSPKIAQTVRSMIAHSFHDAIWIQKYNNMKPIVDKLHAIALQSQQNGDKYILLGHSAGTFITYEYFLYKLPFINMEELFKKQHYPDDKLKQIQQTGNTTTCIDALIDADIFIYKRDNTVYLKEDNFAQKYKKLAEIGKASCIPTNNMAGIINFGSPIPVFYSGFSDNADFTEKEMYMAILDSNMFFLNLNFAEDPLGFAQSTDKEYENILEFAKTHKENNNICPATYGFIYDKSNIRSNKAVFNAHMAYWRKAKFFAKEVVKAYEEGFNAFNIKTTENTSK